MPQGQATLKHEAYEYLMVRGTIYPLPNNGSYYAALEDLSSGKDLLGCKTVGELIRQGYALRGERRSVVATGKAWEGPASPPPLGYPDQDRLGDWDSLSFESRVMAADAMLAKPRVDRAAYYSQMDFQLVLEHLWLRAEAAEDRLHREQSWRETMTEFMQKGP